MARTLSLLACLFVMLTTVVQLTTALPDGVYRLRFTPRNLSLYASPRIHPRLDRKHVGMNPLIATMSSQKKGNILDWTVTTNPDGTTVFQMDDSVGKGYLGVCFQRTNEFARVSDIEKACLTPEPQTWRLTPSDVEGQYYIELTRPSHGFATPIIGIWMTREYTPNLIGKATHRGYTFAFEPVV